MHNGLKYFISFGRYCLFSDSVIEDASVSLPVPPEPSSINDVVDAESDVDKLMAFDSLMNKKATSSINGTISIKYNVVFGVKPISVNAA